MLWLPLLLLLPPLRVLCRQQQALALGCRLFRRHLPLGGRRHTLQVQKRDVMVTSCIIAEKFQEVLWCAQ